MSIVNANDLQFVFESAGRPVLVNEVQTFALVTPL